MITGVLPREWQDSFLFDTKKTLKCQKYIT